MAFIENAANFIVPGYETTEEREARELREQSDGLWGDALSGAPSVNDLMGIGGYAANTPQEYIDQYLTENSYQNPRANRPREHVGTDSGPGLYHEDGGRRRRPGEQSQVAGMLGGVQQERLEAEARQAWLDEQIANDPYFGLERYGDSQVAGVGADPESIAAQRRALQQMGGIYDAGGYTNAERAQLQMAQRDAAMGERSQRLAVQQQAAARGMGGGGMEMMGALAAQQGGANRANDWANQIAVAGQQRALQALQSYGQQAGQMRGQSFDEDRTRRGAADAWHQAQVNQMNQWNQQRGQAAQQAYANRLDATAGATNQYNGSSANMANQAAANTAQTGQILATAAQAAATAFGGPAAGEAAGNAADDLFG